MGELRPETVRRKRQALERANGRPAYVPALGAKRRIQALARQGYSRDDLYRILNPGSTLVQGYFVRGELIHITQHEAIDKLYEKLWNTEGPSARAKMVAQRECWGGPWDWDTDDMDNPNAVPYCCVLRAHIEGLKIHASWSRKHPTWDAETAAAEFKRGSAA